MRMIRFEAKLASPYQEAAKQLKGSTRLLENKTIIITGASSGIGAAAAFLFAKNCARVVLGARRAKELDSIVGQITQSNGKAVALSGDVSDPNYANELVKLAKSEFGGLDGAFNNAGKMGSGAMVVETSPEEWSDTAAVSRQTGCLR